MRGVCGEPMTGDRKAADMDLTVEIAARHGILRQSHRFFVDVDATNLGAGFPRQGQGRGRQRTRSHQHHPRRGIDAKRSDFALH
ncbi:hypothetical protein RF55_18478, partial [Lasius niger]